jgi:hypothetical protein
MDESFKLECATLDMIKEKYHHYFSFIHNHTKLIDGIVEPDKVYLQRVFRLWKAENDYKSLKFDILEKCLVAVYGNQSYEINLRNL